MILSRRTTGALFRPYIVRTYGASVIFFVNVVYTFADGSSNDSSTMKTVVFGNHCSARPFRGCQGWMCGEREGKGGKKDTRPKKDEMKGRYEGQKRTLTMGSSRSTHTTLAGASRHASHMYSYQR